MKKILFTLLLLLTMTSAWAGDGDGSKDHPYTGTWTIMELIQKIKIGDYFAYDCQIVTDYFDKGEIAVTDTKLNKLVVSECRAWTVGLPIDQSPSDCYSAYCSWNSLNDRRKQTFIVTAVTFNIDDNILYLSGYYSGMYLMTNSEGYLEVRNSAEFTAAIKANNSAKIKLEADIDVSKVGTICDTFSGQIYGKHQYTTEDGFVRDTVYILDGKGAGEPLFNNLDYALIEHVMLRSIKISREDDNYGTLARHASNSTLSNFYLYDVEVILSNSNHSNGGGLIGIAEHCTFEDISFNCVKVQIDGLAAGGLVAKSSNSQYTNVVNGPACTIFAEGIYTKNFAQAGGICGYSKNDTFTACGNTAFVGGNEDSVGGFAGLCDNSNFISCINSGVILHAEMDYFYGVYAQYRDALSKLDSMTVEDYLTAECGMTFGGVIVGMVVASFKVKGLYVAAARLAVLSSCCAYCLVAAAVLAAIGLTVYYFSLQHDEIGGICGYARGGDFSRCINRGIINCKDSQGGGIVGRAEGVTVDNCLHTNKCSWGDDDCGGIIGEATKGCKVTNCLSTKDYPIIGAASDMHTDSGNNYSLKAGDNGWEMTVTEEQLKSGIVTIWLNNGVENREIGEKPWRQDLGQDGGKYPDLDPTFNEVTTADITTITHITNAAELTAFAQRVNNGEQFACAVLDKDIAMPAGQTWTPIGKNEANKHFRGVFDGRGHKITGLTCSSSDQPVGLFGSVHSGTDIRNVIIGEDCSFTCGGEAGAGGVVGTVHIGWNWGNVVIENCGSHAEIKGYKHAGGILGHVDVPDDNTNIKVYVNNCYSSGFVYAGHGNSALLCGYMKNNGVVRNCWSNGWLRNLTGDDIWPYSIENPSNPKVAECLVGYDRNLDIKNCYIDAPAVRVDKYSETMDQYPLQAGVEDIPDYQWEKCDITYRLNGNTNDVSKSLAWQQELSVDKYPVLGNKGVYHTRKVSNQYGTVCLPYALKSDDNISYYAFDASSDDNGEIKLNFNYTESVAPSTPVLFRVAETGDVTFSGAGTGWNLDINWIDRDPWTFLAFYYEDVYEGEAAKRVYYVSDGKIKNGKKVTIAPYRAFFAGPSIETLTGDGSTPARVRIVIDGEEDATTALELVYDYEHHNENDNRSYTLFGTEAGEGYRGIVIRGGKKVIVNN